MALSFAVASVALTAFAVCLDDALSLGRQHGRLRRWHGAAAIDAAGVQCGFQRAVAHLATPNDGFAIFKTAVANAQGRGGGRIALRGARLPGRRLFGGDAAEC